MKPRKLSDRPAEPAEPNQTTTAVAEEPQFDNGPADPETEKVIEKVEWCVTDGLLSRGAEEILPGQRNVSSTTAVSEAPAETWKHSTESPHIARNWIVNLQSMWLPRDVNIDASAGCTTPEDVRAVLHKMLDKAIKDIKPTR